MWEFLLEKLEDFRADGGSAGGEALEEGEVVFVDERVADKTDENRRDEEHFFDLVFCYCVEESGHGEGWEHVDFRIQVDGQVKLMDEAGDCQLRLAGLEKRALW